MKRFFWIFLLTMNAALLHAESESPLKIIALGDSTTAGTPGFCSQRECPPAGRGNLESQYTYWIAKRHPEWQVLNHGVNGERSDQILARFEKEILRQRPNVLIVLAGVNDLYQGRQIGGIQKNLLQIYRGAQKAGMRVLACTVIPYNFSSPEVKQKMKDLNEWIRVISLREGIGFCDTYGAVNDPAAPGNLARTPDGLHPDVMGYHAMGDAITDCLESFS